MIFKRLSHYHKILGPQSSHNTSVTNRPHMTPVYTVTHHRRSWPSDAMRWRIIRQIGYIGYANKGTTPCTRADRGMLWRWTTFAGKQRSLV